MRNMSGYNDPTPQEALRRIITKDKRRNKYGNQHVLIDGHRFDSKAEARRYGELKLLLRAGEISDLVIHKRFTLHAGIVYECDFFYMEKGKAVAEDVKGVETKEFKLKKRLFKVDCPDVELRVIPAKG